MLGKCWEKKERKKGKNKENQWMKIGKKPLNKQISNTPPHQKKKKKQWTSKVGLTVTK